MKKHLLTALAALLLGTVATVAFCMSSPVRWDGIGKLGAVFLMFPLHLLVLAAVAAPLALVARKAGATPAAAGFGLVALASAVTALAPALAIRGTARELSVPLSLGTYLAGAGRLNLGDAQPARTVVYGTAKDGTRLELDVWRTGKPAEGPRRPAMVIVHGGSWISGNRSSMPAWDAWFAEQGYEVFDVEYRMPPPLRWQDEIGDVKAALGWIVAHAAEYHVDPARIGVFGYSAGANLSMLAAYSAGDARLPPSCDVPAVPVRCVVNLYGPTDLALGYRECDSTEFVRHALRTYVGGTPDEQAERYALLSPLTHVGPKSPPTITFHGTRDRLVRLQHAELLRDALIKAGVAQETYILAGTEHGFDANWGGFATQIARVKVQEFLARHLR